MAGPNQQISFSDSLYIVGFGLLAALGGAAMTYAELTAWDSMVGFVPGLVLWPMVALIGVLIVFWGVSGMLRHHH